MCMYIYIYTHTLERASAAVSLHGIMRYGGFLSHGGDLSHHGCFNAKSWSPKTWMIRGSRFRKRPANF